MKNMGNKRFGQKGLYKPDFRSKSQIANTQGGQREYTNIPTQKTPTDAKAIKEKELAELKRKTVGTIRKTTDADREAQNRQSLTFAGNAQKRGASSPLNDVLDMVNPFSYYYSAKDVGKGLGQTAQGIANLDPGQIGAGLTQAGLNTLAVLPGAAELKPALRGASKAVSNTANKLNPFKRNFKSEIDWAKWNPETPKHKVLMDEYNAIEESTKKGGTWMKNPDGSAFKGTPEQFVQQNSENFKKAFGRSKLVNPDGSSKIIKHGSEKNDIEIFKSPSQQENFKKRTATTKDTEHIFFSQDDHWVNNFARKDGKVYNVYANVENPRITNTPEEMYNPETIPNFRDYDAITNLKLGEKDTRPFREIAIPNWNNVKSAVGNVGFFDMTNPNIYKGLIPGGLGLGAAQQYLQNKPKGTYQMGGTMSVPGVNGQVVSSGPHPLTSVKKTRGPITKNKKGDVKTMSNQQVKQVLKYSKQKPNKI
jgi:hypothetical protein